MPAIDSRHAEKSALFKLLLAEATGDIKTQIAAQKAQMEKDDIQDVIQEFEKWKENK